MNKRIYLFSAILLGTVLYISASEKNEDDDTESSYQDALSSPSDLNIENKNFAENAETEGAPSSVEQTKMIQQHMGIVENQPRENMMQRYKRHSPDFVKDGGENELVSRGDTPISDESSLKEYEELDQDKKKLLPLRVTNYLKSVNKYVLEEALKEVCKKLDINISVLPVDKICNYIKNYLSEVAKKVLELGDFLKKNEKIIFIVGVDNNVITFKNFNDTHSYEFHLEDVVACYAFRPAFFDKSFLRKYVQVNKPISLKTNMSLKDTAIEYLKSVKVETLKKNISAVCEKFKIALPLEKNDAICISIKNYVHEVGDNIIKLQDFFERNQNIIVIVNPENNILIFQSMGSSVYQPFSLEDVVACYAIMPALFNKIVRQERYLIWRIKQMGVSLRERFSGISHWLFGSFGDSPYLHSRKKPQLALTDAPVAPSTLPQRIYGKPSSGLKDLLEPDDSDSHPHYITRAQFKPSISVPVKD